MLKVLACKYLVFTSTIHLRKNNGSYVAHIAHKRTNAQKWVIGQSRLRKMKDGVNIYACSRAFSIEKSKRNKTFLACFLCAS